MALYPKGSTNDPRTSLGGSHFFESLWKNNVSDQDYINVYFIMYCTIINVICFALLIFVPGENDLLNAVLTDGHGTKNVMYVMSIACDISYTILSFYLMESLKKQKQWILHLFL